MSFILLSMYMNTASEEQFWNSSEHKTF